MKRLLTISTIFLIFLVSCGEEDPVSETEFITNTLRLDSLNTTIDSLTTIVDSLSSVVQLAPTSCFEMDFTESEGESDIDVGQEITFENCSEGAISYLWDFGNGYTTTEENPVISYESGGTFTIRLTAFGADSVSTSQDTLVVAYSLAQYIVGSWNFDTITDCNDNTEPVEDDDITITVYENGTLIGGEADNGLEDWSLDGDIFIINEASSDEERYTAVATETTFHLTELDQAGDCDLTFNLSRIGDFE